MKEEPVRFSNKELFKSTKVEKSLSGAKSTKKANKKSSGKYVTKIVDGVKYMVLSDNI